MRRNTGLALCDPHCSIIHEYGCDIVCTKNAGICLKGCCQSDHLVKNNKHEFVSTRQFNAFLSTVRGRFKSFEVDFRQSYLKRFVKQLKEAVENFQQFVLNEVLEKTPLVEVFCRYSGSETFQDVIAGNDVDLSELACKDVHHLKFFYNSLQRQSLQEQQLRVNKLLQRVLENYLKNSNLISPLRPEKAPPPPINFNTESISDVTTRLSQTVTKIVGLKPVQMSIMFTQEIAAFEKECEDERLVGQFYDQVQATLERTGIEKLALFVNGPIMNNLFWQKLPGLCIVNGLKNLEITTSGEVEPPGWLNEQLKGRCSKDTQFSIRNRVQWLNNS